MAQKNLDKCQGYKILKKVEFVFRIALGMAAKILCGAAQRSRKDCSGQPGLRQRPNKTRLFLGDLVADAAQRFGRDTKIGRDHVLRQSVGQVGINLQDFEVFFLGCK